MLLVGSSMFSATVNDHVANPRNCGEMQDSTHYGQCGIPGEGPYVQIWLRIESGLILRASQKTNGCPSQIASASITAQLLTGRTVERALLLEPHDIELILGGLPEGKGHCPQMVVDALQQALTGVSQ